MTIKKGQFKRGYSPLHKYTEHKGRFVADCRSCHYWYSPDQDSPEQCNNKGVTNFDMAKDESTGRIYCTYWRRVQL